MCTAYAQLLEISTHAKTKKVLIYNSNECKTPSWNTIRKDVEMPSLDNWAIEPRTKTLLPTILVVWEGSFLLVLNGTVMTSSTTGSWHFTVDFWCSKPAVQDFKDDMMLDEDMKWISWLSLPVFSLPVLQHHWMETPEQWTTSIYTYFCCI